jgi:hypothetical protein
MSREALREFVHAVEHSAALRRDCHQVEDAEGLIVLALRYGFAINHQDLDDDARCEAIDAWFATSRIQRKRSNTAR